MALRRIRRRGRVRQPLLPHQGGKIDPTLGFERRWVIYNGYAEASTCRRPGTAGCITPSTRRRPQEATQPREWQKPHRPNMTGTPGAFVRPARRWRKAAARRRPAITSPGLPELGAEALLRAFEPEIAHQLAPLLALATRDRPRSPRATACRSATGRCRRRFFFMSGSAMIFFISA